MAPSSEVIDTMAIISPPSTNIPTATTTTTATIATTIELSDDVQRDTLRDESPRRDIGALAHLANCFMLPGWRWISSTTKRDTTGTVVSSNRNVDFNDNYEIPIECIETNFQTNYIGGGNQSSVFHGHWNGRPIALKKLDRASEMLDIRKLVALDHPNVVKTLGAVTKDIPAIVMEYCEQGNLFDVLHRKQVVDKARFLRWSREIAAGMEYIHRRKIVHRDLKSPNVLVDANYVTKIGDFGSLYQYTNTNMGSVNMTCCGTSQWMAPELMKNLPSSEKVDVWSYACCLWELLTQEIPYKNITSMAILYGVGSGKLTLHVPPTFPDTCKLLLKMCFAQRPRNRPSFISILRHLENTAVELAPMSEDAWTMRKGVWKREVNEESDRRRAASNDELNEEARRVDEQLAADLVKKRIAELRHAEELSLAYKSKYRRVCRLIKKITTQSAAMTLVEHEIADKKAHLKILDRMVAKRKAELGMATEGDTQTRNSLFSTAASCRCEMTVASTAVPQLKSVRLQRSTMAKSDARGEKAQIDVCEHGGRRAILSIEVPTATPIEKTPPPVTDEGASDQSDISDGEELFESDAENSVGWDDADIVQFVPPPQYAHHYHQRYGSAIARDTPPLGSVVYSSSDDEADRPVDTTTTTTASSMRSRHSCIAMGAAGSTAAAAASSCTLHRATASTTQLPLERAKFDAFGDEPAAMAATSTTTAAAAARMGAPAFVCACGAPFVCVGCSSAFRRNSTNRVSGMSADSGVASSLCGGGGIHSASRQMSALQLAADDEYNGNSSGGGGATTTSPPIYRNQQARWSDGRIAHRHTTRWSHSTAASTPRRSAATPNTARRSAFSRESPARVSAPSRHRRRTSSMSTRANISHPVDESTLTTADVAAAVDAVVDVEPRVRRSHSVQTTRPTIDSTSSTIAANAVVNLSSSSRASIVCDADRSNHDIINNDNDDQDGWERMSVDETNTIVGSSSTFARPSPARRPVLEETITEMSSSLSSKSTNRSPKRLAHSGVAGMEQSTTSTMASSLEHALEAGMLDGLSDQESKLHAVKNSFRTHRRCASNPTCILDNCGRIVETTAETEELESPTH